MKLLRFTVIAPFLIVAILSIFVITSVLQERELEALDRWIREE